MGRSDIALVSGCDRLRYASYVGHQLYARRHDLDYHLELAPFEGVTGYWHKVAALRRHLAHHDWVVWLDDDAFITDLDDPFIRREIGRAEGAGAWLAIAPSCPRELNGAWAAYNTGVMALANTPQAHALLAAMDVSSLEAARAWWDHERLGMFTAGDQDVLVWHLETHGLLDGVHWVDPLRWNARAWYYRDDLADAPVCHFAGQPDTTLAIHDFARRMGTDETLVRPGRPAVSRDLHHQRPAIGRPGAAVRRLGVRGASLGRRVRRKIAWVREQRRWS